MIMDYHIHAKASPDDIGDMEDYTKEARKRRIDEIGFSEHIIFHHEKNYAYRPSDFMSETGLDPL